LGFAAYPSRKLKIHSKSRRMMLYGKAGGRLNSTGSVSPSPSGVARVASTPSFGSILQ
jgi:hypothetical protein